MLDALETVSLIAPMLGVVAVIIAAYLTTRWLATRSSVKPVGKRIRVIERVPLTRDTYLALVRVRARTYLLSVGPGRVEQIGELEGGEFAPGGGRPGDDFESLLSQRMRHFRGQPAEEAPRRFREQEADERPRRLREQEADERPRRFREQEADERPRRGARR